MTFGAVLTTVLGIMMSLGHFPQAYKIWKSKSGDNISLMTYSIFAAGSLVWVLYGVSVSDMVIVYSFVPGVIGSWLVLILTIYYRRKKIS